MYMKDNKNYIKMMGGGFGEFTQYELWAILSYQNELGINTLKIQKTSPGKFICCVDEPTSKKYKEKI